MALWPTNPEWNPAEQINNGNEYTPRDGLVYTDINKLVQNILYLYSYGSADAEIVAEVQRLSKKVAQLEEAVNKLTYVPIEISQFNVTPMSVEIGSTVTNPVLSWVINKTPHILMLNNSALPANATSYTVNGTFTEDTSWTLTAEDDEQEYVKRKATLSFLNGVYYGVSADPYKLPYSSEFVRSLTKTLRNSKLTSFSVNAGEEEYIYYCVPSRFGPCEFSVGGFIGGFTLVDIIEFTNASGYTERYYIYRSDNANLGVVNIIVK